VIDTRKALRLSILVGDSGMKPIKLPYPWPVDLTRAFGVILVFLGVTDAFPVVLNLIVVVNDRFFKWAWALPYLIVDLSFIIAGLAFIARHPRKGVLTAGLAALDILCIYAWVAFGP
jgi:hypothetical protein